MPIERALASAGLTKKEAAVYLACLKMGSAGVNAIAKEARVFRTYAYDILNSLAEKGLVHSIVKKGTRLYEAADPEQLLRLLQQRELDVKESLPGLKSLRHTANTSSVQCFEGLAGLNAIHDAVLRESPYELLAFANPDNHYEAMRFYLKRFVAARVEKGIRARVIISDSKIGREWMLSEGEKEFRETRFFPENPEDFPAITYLWNSKVAHFTVKDKVVAVLIDDQNIALSHKTIFESLWGLARRN